jgi:hypothetical protein
MNTGEQSSGVHFVILLKVFGQCFLCFLELFVSVLLHFGTRFLCPALHSHIQPLNARPHPIATGLWWRRSQTQRFTPLSHFISVELRCWAGAGLSGGEEGLVKRRMRRKKKQRMKKRQKRS